MSKDATFWGFPPGFRLNSRWNASFPWFGMNFDQLFCAISLRFEAELL
jgi:hypothetical protein